MFITIAFKENQQLTKKMKNLTTGKETKWATTRMFAKEDADLDKLLVIVGKLSSEQEKIVFLGLFITF